MPVSVLQSAAAVVTVNATPHLPVAFTNPCTKGNVLVAFVGSPISTQPTSVTDTLSNVWQCVSISGNIPVENYSVWVCQNCRSTGANTVTANGPGMSGTIGGPPSIIVAEIVPPPCPIGGLGIQGFSLPLRGDNFNPYLTLLGTYMASEGPFYHAMLVGIYDFAHATTSRTWSYVTPSSVSGVGGIINQVADTIDSDSSALAITFVAYPNVFNGVQFAYTPTSPPLVAGETHVYGIIISTVT